MGSSSNITKLSNSVYRWECFQVGNDVLEKWSFHMNRKHQIHNVVHVTTLLGCLMIEKFQINVVHH